MKFYKYTNIGPRKLNEDSLFVTSINDNIFACVADGVGGLKNGEFASNYVVEQFSKYCLENTNHNFENFLSNANKELITLAKVKFNLDSVGTTFTGGEISTNKIFGIHAGDSRVCVLRKNGIKQLTNDQNEVSRLISEGKMSFAEKKYYPRKNIIESVVGHNELFSSQIFQFDLLVNDRIIFSTDGFHEALTKKEIRDISLKAKSIDEFGRRLKIEIENRILHDNCTFIIVEI